MGGYASHRAHDLTLLATEEVDELGARRVVPDKVRVLGVAVEQLEDVCGRRLVQLACDVGRQERAERLAHCRVVGCGDVRRVRAAQPRTCLH